MSLFQESFASVGGCDCTNIIVSAILQGLALPGIPFETDNERKNQWDQQDKRILVYQLS